MKDKTKLLTGVAIIILVGVVIIAGWSRGQYHQASPEKKIDWLVDKISDELELTDDQKTKLHGIKGDILAREYDFEGMRTDVYDETLSQAAGQSVDQEKLNRLFEEKEAEWKEMRSFLIDNFAEFHGMLNSKQRDTLVELIQKHDRSRRRWHR